MTIRKPTTLDELRARIGHLSASLTPRVRDAARYAIEHPNDIALNPVAAVARTSGVAASANGRKRGPIWAQRAISVRLSRFMARCWSGTRHRAGGARNGVPDAQACGGSELPACPRAGPSHPVQGFRWLFRRRSRSSFSLSVF